MIAHLKGQARFGRSNQPAAMFKFLRGNNSSVQSIQSSSGSQVLLGFFRPRPLVACRFSLKMSLEYRIKMLTSDVFTDFLRIRLYIQKGKNTYRDGKWKHKPNFCMFHNSAFYSPGKVSYEPCGSLSRFPTKLGLLWDALIKKLNKRR